MKKDIKISEVSHVYIAVVNEFNDTYKTHDWNAYIINDKTVDLEMLLIMTRGYSETKATSTMRHKLEKLPAKSYAKIELMHDDVLALNNEFVVTFFENNKMFDKSFVFRKNTINKKALQPIPLMECEGVLAK